MAASDRPTAPPDPLEAADLAAFEAQAKAEGEDKARLRYCLTLMRDRRAEAPAVRR